MDYGYRHVSIGDILLLYLFHRKMVACFLRKAHGQPSFRFDLLNDINYDTYSGY